MRLALRTLWPWLTMIILVGCNQGLDLPTTVPTVSLPTPAPTSTQLPTLVPEPTATVPTPTPSVTPVLSELQPTRVIVYGVNITSPNADQAIMQGREESVSGLVQLDAGDTLSVSLVSATGYELALAQVELNDFNSWQGSLVVPYYVGGWAEIQAVVLDHLGNIVALDQIPVSITVDIENTDRYLQLFRPTVESKSVAGYHLFFDGVAQQAVDNLLTISVRNESCRNEIARQSYRLRGSGYWQGFLPIPRNTVGPVCAITHFGIAGDSNWREIQVPLVVTAADDEQAKGVTIGNPPPGQNIDRGKRLLLYGTAYNALENQILVSVLLENGRLLTETMTVVDFFGYWEIDLYIPADASGPALIEASFGERGTDDYINHVVPVTIGSNE